MLILNQITITTSLATNYFNANIILKYFHNFHLAFLYHVALMTKHSNQASVIGFEMASPDLNLSVPEKRAGYYQYTIG